jgi:hypothetical protein
MCGNTRERSNRRPGVEVSRSRLQPWIDTPDEIRAPALRFTDPQPSVGKAEIAMPQSLI